MCRRGVLVAVVSFFTAAPASAGVVVHEVNYQLYASATGEDYGTEPPDFPGAPTYGSDYNSGTIVAVDLPYSTPVAVAQAWGPNGWGDGYSAITGTYVPGTSFGVRVEAYASSAGMYSGAHHGGSAAGHVSIWFDVVGVSALFDGSWTGTSPSSPYAFTLTRNGQGVALPFNTGSGSFEDFVLTPGTYNLDFWKNAASGVYYDSTSSISGFSEVSITTVPEASTVVLTGIGLLGVFAAKKKGQLRETIFACSEALKTLQHRSTLRLRWWRR